MSVLNPPTRSPRRDDPPADDRLERARAFLTAARSRQQACGNVVRGVSHRTGEVREQARQAQVTGEALGPLPPLYGERLPGRRRRALYDRFAELCRRHDLTIPRELAPWVYRLLAEELAENADRLRVRPATLVSATLHTGRLGPVIDAYPEYHDTPYVFRAAVRNQPVCPARFLDRVREALAAMTADPRAAAFRDNPRLLRRVAVFYPGDPLGALLDGRDPSLRPAARHPRTVGIPCRTRPPLGAELVGVAERPRGGGAAA